MTDLPIFCGDCGSTGSVKLAQLSQPLMCKCGSSNLGLEGVDRKVASSPEDVDFETGRVHGQDGLQPRQSSRAYLDGHAQGSRELQERWARFAARSGQPWMQGTQIHTATPQGPGTGWNGPDPRRTEGWSEYAGPTPQVAPRSAPVADPVTCPVCKGSGYDLIDKARCRECGGTGVITHPTQSPNPQFGESLDPGRPLPQGGSHLYASRKVAFGDEHVTHYVNWARSKGLDPDEASALKRYEKENANVGRAHTNFLADQLYIGGGGEDWRREAGRSAKVPELSPEYQIGNSTPGYSPQGYKGPRDAGPFSPDNSDSYYPKAQNRSPAHTYREDRDYSAPSGPYRMDEASCPSCGTRPTELRKDKNEDAWWVCPHCGPLANIDRNPSVNPYSPPENFQPNRKMKTGGFLARNHQTGQIFKMLAVLHEHNELTEREALSLARESVRRYGEGR